MRQLKLEHCRLDGRYNILECLGRGSYAEIYRAEDTEMGGLIVVIKALNIYLQGDPEEDLERTLIENFQNEATALDRVRHPNIIRRYGHGTALDLENHSFHYLVLEYLPGGDIYSVCRRHPLELEQMLYYANQVSAGLAHAHDKQVIHRDIKPQNLLLSADRKTLKIADFGVAKLDPSEDLITRVGTNVYAPPEHNPGLAQTNDLRRPPTHLTPAADIYSLAKTLYTMLTGDSPKRFTHRPIDEFPSVIAAHAWAAPVLRVLRRATQNEPPDRQQNVREFWRELAEAAVVTAPPENGATDSLRRSVSKDLPLEVAAPPPPPRPVFQSAGTLIERETARRNPIPLPNGGNGAAAVVNPLPVTPQYPKTPFAPEAPAPLPTVQTTPTAREILHQMPDAPLKPALQAQARRNGDSRLRRIVISLLLLGAFAGILLATNSYLRSRRTQQPTTAALQNLAGREGVALTNVNLREQAGADKNRIGLVEKGSRVRVIGEAVSRNDDSWVEIQILQHGSPKADPNASDRGWVNARYLDLN